MNDQTIVVAPDKPITLTPDNMHGIFVLVKNAIGELIQHQLSHLPGGPDFSNVVDVAISSRSASD